MIDRIFSALMLALALAYVYIAFAIIKAPFQYDPLGPESWPQILSVYAALCCLYLLFKPDDIDWDLKKHSPLGSRKYSDSDEQEEKVHLLKKSNPRPMTLAHRCQHFALATIANRTIILTKIIFVK